MLILFCYLHESNINEFTQLTHLLCSECPFYIFKKLKSSGKAYRLFTRLGHYIHKILVFESSPPGLKSLSAEKSCSQTYNLRATDRFIVPVKIVLENLPKFWIGRSHMACFVLFLYYSGHRFISCRHVRLKDIFYDVTTGNVVITITHVKANFFYNKKTIFENDITIMDNTMNFYFWLNLNNTE